MKDVKDVKEYGRGFILETLTLSSSTVSCYQPGESDTLWAAHLRVERVRSGERQCH